MAASPPWYRVAADRAVLRRATITGVGVGTLLSIANNVDDLRAGRLPADQLLPIAITFVVPFLVSIASSVIALRVERRDQATTSDLLEREVAAINKFPGQNPNPVLRMTERGRLTYANASAAPILAALQAAVGVDLAPEWADRFRAAAATSPPERVEVQHERQTFAVLAVHVADLGVYNLYGTDITAAKVVERFPGGNPNPVLRMTPTGELWYANDASRPITAALEIEVGEPLPKPLLDRLQARLADATAALPEVAGEGGRTYRLTPVLIPEFDFVNLYGTDITAEKAVDKFPNQNPNPVLRVSRAARLTYANPASALVRKALGAEVGDELDPAMFGRILHASEDPSAPTIELEAENRIFRILVISVYEFDSINLYGTDITAAREVETLNAENERLLLNILPASIAARLRSGETWIADRFDDMTVLFADVVGFTELSSRLTPAEVVRLLSDVFSMCDQLAEQFHLEKIKTVGDAYMVVGGLAETAQVQADHADAGHAGQADAGHAGHAGHADGNSADRADGIGAAQEVEPGPPHTGTFASTTHAADVADMALAILRELDALSTTTGPALQVRVGMHVGPAVAGVIGLKKFIYDVWGDTVNTASRMESTGVPGRVQVTRETYERLRDQFEFERRGVVTVKGKGDIETWFLVGRR
jgi:class 3 adenylate cyclase